MYRTLKRLYSLTEGENTIAAFQKLWAEEDKQVLQRLGVFPDITPALVTSKVPPAAKLLIKRHEGFSPKAYRCPSGIWTVGWGFTQIHGRPVTEQDTLTEAEAEVLLDAELERLAEEVDRLVNVPLNPNQLSALISFVYNVGLNAFAKSTLLKRINAQDPKASEEFDRWVNGANGPLPGLVKRRAEERALYEAKP